MNIDSTIFIGFLIITIIIGLVSSTGIKTIKEYAIGNQNFSTITIAATLVATWVSGDTFFTQLSEVYTNGLYFIWAQFGEVVCFLIIGCLFAPRLGEFLGKLSIAEAMGDLYGEKVRIITAISGFIGAAGMIAMQLKVSGLLFEYCFGVSQIYGVIISGVIVTLYSALGGIRSVTFTDLIQLFTFGTIVPTIAFFILKTLDNATSLISTISNSEIFNYHEVFDFNQPKSVYFLFLFLFIAIPGFNPAIFQRIAMAKNVTQVRQSFIIAAFTCGFISFITFGVAILVLSSGVPIENNDIVKHILFDYSYVGLRGLTLAGIMAMLMSTADSYINSSAVLVVHDFCKPLGIKLHKKELILSRFASLLVGIFSIILALRSGSLLQLLIATNTFYMPVVTVPFTLAVFGFRTSSKSILIGMGAGFVAVIIWETFFKVGIIDGLIPGMMANLVFLIGSHYLLNQPGGWVGIKDKASLVNIKTQRAKNIKKTFQAISYFNFLEFCKKNSPKSEGPIALFGLFIMVSVFSNTYTLPRMLQLQYSYLLDIFYPVILFTATAFISYPLWLSKWKQAGFIAVFLNITMFLTLICFGFLMVMISNFAEIQLMIFMVNIILISVLVRWQWALVLILTGTILVKISYSNYLKIDPSTELVMSEFKTVYLLLLVSSILIIFLKPKQDYQELTEEKNEHLTGRIGSQEKQLREAYALKGEFIRNISHEYHAPLTGITSMAQVLAESYDKLNELQRREAIDTILQSSRKLDIFDSNISSLALLSKAGYELKLEPVNLSEFLNDRIEICRKIYEENKEDREFVLDIEEDIFLNIDKYYLTQTLDNLIINAITYCKKGNISIILKHKADEVICTIQDDGIGIPADELEEIFNEFTVSSRTKTPSGGRGVGLALCKRVIEVHGGRIWAESKGKKGSVFSFTIPVN